MGLAGRAVAGLLGLAAARPGAAMRRPDIAYAPGPRGRLDLYLPRRPAPGSPIAVFFYGGSWQSGERGFYRFVGAALAAQGIATAIPDYRVHPEVGWPDFLHDCAQATAFVRREAAGWGADPARLFLIGQSAGAYNAAMLALDRRWLGAAGLEPADDLAGVIAIAGPYDFLPLRSATLKIIFGPGAGPQTQPMTHAHGGAPPMLLLVGGKDAAVRPGNTVRLARAIKAEGGKVEHRIYANLGHQGSLTALLPPLRRRAPVMRDILAFIDRQSRGRATA
jgi:acetyl esterase/lipase